MIRGAFTDPRLAASDSRCTLTSLYDGTCGATAPCVAFCCSRSCRMARNSTRISFACSELMPSAIADGATASQRAVSMNRYLTTCTHVGGMQLPDEHVKRAWHVWPHALQLLALVSRFTHEL